MKSPNKTENSSHEEYKKSVISINNDVEIDSGEHEDNDSLNYNRPST